MADNVQIATPNDFMSGLSANAVQRLMTNNMNIEKALRTNGLLRKDEWIEIDRTVVQVARERLTGIADLRAKGLVRNLGGLGTLIDQWETQGDMSPADVNMSGVTAGKEDTPAWNLHGVPVPIIHKDFRINIRRLYASRNLGQSLDTVATAVATRKVTESLEDMLFAGDPTTMQGFKIYGYTNHPDINTGALSDWSNITNIYNDVKDMIKDAKKAGYYGPYTLYVSSDEDDNLNLIYDDSTGQTARERVMKLNGIEEIKVADRLASGTVILVQMTSDVVDLSLAQDIVPIEWNTQGGMVSHFKVFCAMVPRIKSDDNGKSGIVVYS